MAFTPALPRSTVLRGRLVPTLRVSLRAGVACTATVLLLLVGASLRPSVAQSGPSASDTTTVASSAPPSASQPDAQTSLGTSSVVVKPAYRACPARLAASEQMVAASTPGSLGAWTPQALPPTGVQGLNPQSGIRWGRFAGVTTAMAASYTGIFLYEKSQWWDGQGSGFHFDSHLNYARNFDKISHFYAGEVQALINTRALEWSGVPHGNAALWGSITSLAAQTHVEIHDGFSRSWGFDWYDQAANTLGAAWFYAHDRVPTLRRFDVRWSYYPSNVWLDNLEARQEEGNMFADDYSGHSYWMSMRVHDLLPGAAGRLWPEALHVSFGASLHDWTDETWSDWQNGRGPDPDAYVAYYVSLDLDWRKIIPRDSWLGRSTGDFLNRFHLPFPAIRVWPEPGVHLVFVGQE